jgi:GntR family transcriptional repressor for pyruvate dehydrogenase complex
MTNSLNESGNRHPNSLTHDVKAVLTGWIRDGKYPPGSQLPSVPDLVRQLGVSRTVVREALQTLVGRNLIVMRPGLGCFVNTLPPELIVNTDVFASLLDIDALIEVAIARRAIEAAVARVAASTANSNDIDNLREALTEIEAVALRNRPMYSVTPAFHVAVARATHNSVLEKTVESFNSLMVRAGEIIEQRNAGEAYRVAEYESHRLLLEAILSGDPDRARDEMEAHITLTVDCLLAVRARDGEGLRLEFVRPHGQGIGCVRPPR